MELLFIFTFGLVIGSFLNVCIFRIPRKESLWYPASHCTTCKHKLSVLDLFPIFSYIFLKGRCRYCNSKINIQYPIIELVTPILYLFLFNKFYLTFDFCKYIFFVSLLIIIFTIDLQNKIIPNKLILLGFLTILILKILEICGSDSYKPLLYSILGLLIGAFPLFIVNVFTKGGIGSGDIKLMAVIGMWLGIKYTYLTLFLGFIGAGIIAILLISLNKINLKSEMALAPFLTSAAFISLMYGKIIIEFVFFSR